MRTPRVSVPFYFMFRATKSTSAATKLKNTISERLSRLAGLVSGEASDADEVSDAFMINNSRNGTRARGHQGPPRHARRRVRVTLQLLMARRCAIDVPVNGKREDLR